MGITEDKKCPICNNHQLNQDGKCTGCLQASYLCTCPKKKGGVEEEEFTGEFIEEEFIEEEERGGMEGL